jgi:uncharacterized membrane protein YoaK (UPF0700 family)
MSPVFVMILMLVAGVVIGGALEQGSVFVCFALMAPVFAVMAKRSEDRRHQRRSEELMRKIAEKK